MQIDISQRPANSIAKISFAQGEEITAEGGSMVAMSGGLSVETTTYQRGKRGFGRAFKRSFAGEGVFLNHYRAENAGASLYVAPSLSGDIVSHHLAGEGMIVQAGSFLAHEHSIDMDMSWQGLKTLFSGEQLFWLRLAGSGQVLLNSFGAIYSVDVDGEYIVDSGHVVAFEEGLEFKISKVGKSWVSSFLGGEGLVCRFKGRGRLWCQSHSPRGFGRLLGPMLAPIEQYV